MSRYAPLGTFLRDQLSDHVPVTFEQIEAVLGATLPASKRYPAWWSNNPTNNPMTRIWLDAGFITEQVDTPGMKLVFRRAEQPLDGMAEATVPFLGGGLLARLQASLGGTVRFAPDFDATEPTGEIWDAAR